MEWGSTKYISRYILSNWCWTLVQSATYSINPVTAQAMRNCFIVNWTRSQNQSSKTAIIVWNMFRTDPKHPQLKWIRRSCKLVYKNKIGVTTGCLNLLCPTSNQHFFRLKWHSKHKPSIFGMLSRGDLCLVHRFFFLFVFYTASTASDLQGVKIQGIWSHAALNLKLWD